MLSAYKLAIIQLESQQKLLHLHVHTHKLDLTLSHMHNVYTQL